MAKILAVLTQDEITNHVCASLQDACHRVTFVNAFAGAMDILRSENIDLIISDIRLQNDDSDYSGVFDFLRWVKGDPLLCSIPFICLSLQPIQNQLFYDGVMIAARSLGAAACVTMDMFDPASFQQEIESLLPMPDKQYSAEGEKKNCFHNAES